MPVYIGKINGDVDRPTDQPTNQPTDQQGKYRAICLFECQKIEKKAEICNIAKVNNLLVIHYKGLDPGGNELKQVDIGGSQSAASYGLIFIAGCKAYCTSTNRTRYICTWIKMQAHDHVYHVAASKCRYECS